jgi:serine/threonine-protein phosphatase 5
VDRGAYSVEIVLTLLAFKLLYPRTFFLSRGNHEFYSLNKIYGFEAEVKKKFDASFALLFSELFKSIPVCHLINDHVFVTHGGLHSGTTTLNDIRSINRFVDAPPGSLFESLLWSDPSSESGIRPSHRGAGIMFGPDVTKQFLATNNLSIFVLNVEYVIRSHEFKPSGYEISHDGLLYTIFSAPNY